MAALHREGLAGAPTLHQYHCDCDVCRFTAPWPLRGQTDSSCSGEIISSVFAHGDEGELHHISDRDYRTDWSDTMDALQRLAVDVDAEPGWSSGFHVHVGANWMTATQKARALWAFIRWEPVLGHIAAGRFGGQREENTSVREQMFYNGWVGELSAYVTEGRTYHEFDDVYDCTSLIDRAHTLENERTRNDVMMTALNLHAGDDRHNNLNIRTNHGTWEYRLWNSTRSAWRMEMFTRLSVAMVDPDVVDKLLVYANPDNMTIGRGVSKLRYALKQAGHERCAELVRRQHAYLTSGEEIPSSLTSL